MTRCTCTTYGNCVACRPIKESPEWRVGQLGELEIRSYLERLGKFVVPTTSIENGGAPVLTRLQERYVLPDFQAFGAGVGEWWEVKTKTKRLFYRLRNTFQHGIDEPLWYQYLQVEQVTGLPGYLAIVQLDDPALLYQSFRILDRCAQAMRGSTAAYDSKRLVFWDVDDFERVEPGSDLRRMIERLPTPPPLDLTPIPQPKVQANRQPRLWDDL